MNSIEISRFKNSEALIDFFNKAFSFPFFDSTYCDKTFIDQFIQGEIKIVEHEYLIPIEDMCNGEEHDLKLSNYRKGILRRFKGRGSIIEDFRSSIIKLFNPNFSTLEVCNNILIENNSKSATFIGAFTLQKLSDLICTDLMVKIEHIYVFTECLEPPVTSIPFFQSTFYEFLISNTAKKAILDAYNSCSLKAAQNASKAINKFF